MICLEDNNGSAELNAMELNGGILISMYENSDVGSDCQLDRNQAIELRNFLNNVLDQRS